MVLISFYACAHRPAFCAPQSPTAAGAPLPTATYRALHVHALKEAKAQPMLNTTRVLLDNFYRPHNLALAATLGWAHATAWPVSTVVDAVALSRPA